MVSVTENTECALIFPVPHQITKMTKEHPERSNSQHVFSVNTNAEVELAWQIRHGKALTY